MKELEYSKLCDNRKQLWTMQNDIIGYGYFGTYVDLRNEINRFISNYNFEIEDVYCSGDGIITGWTVCIKGNKRIWLNICRDKESWKRNYKEKYYQIIDLEASEV
jgi:hypothetical protein